MLYLFLWLLGIPVCLIILYWSGKIRKDEDGFETFIAWHGAFLWPVLLILLIVTWASVNIHRFLLKIFDKKNSSNAGDK